MYNEATKMNFMDTISNESAKKEILSVFKTIEELEIKYGVDVCEMNISQASEVANKIVGLAVRESTNKTTRISVIQRYVKWCLENNVRGANNNILHVKASPIQKIKERFLSNPLHFQKELDMLFAPVEECTVDNVYRAILWMMYSGLPKEDYIKVLCSDFDFEEMVFFCDNEKYPIYKEALKTTKSAISLKEFKYFHSNYPAPIMKSRYDGNELSRGVSGIVKLPTLQTTINQRISKLNSNNIFVTEIAYENIRKSGVFFRALEMERSGFEVSFEALTVKELKKKMESKPKDEQKPISNTQIVKHSRIYKLEYLNWKEAFGYMYN